MYLLCGYGGDSRRVDEIEVKKKILDLCSGKKVAIITNAKPENDIQTCIEVDKFLTKNNIVSKIFDLNKDDRSWQNFDVIYLGGGSPLRLMEAIKNNNYFYFDWKSKIIIGQSAGAMILFDKFCDNKDIFDRELQLEDFDIYNGLGLIRSDKVFTPHYNSLNSNYGKLYLKKLENEGLETIKLIDGDYIIYK